MPSPDQASHTSLLRSTAAGDWLFDTNDGGESMRWQTPPAVLGRLIRELFLVQPEDTLTWLHSAVWRMYKDELFNQTANPSRVAKTASSAPVIRDRMALISDVVQQETFFAGDSMEPTEIAEMGKSMHQDAGDVEGLTSSMSQAHATDKVSGALSPNSPQNSGLRKLFLRSASSMGQAGAMAQAGSGMSVGSDDDSTGGADELSLSLRRWPAGGSILGATQRRGRPYSGQASPYSSQGDDSGRPRSPISVSSSHTVEILQPVHEDCESLEKGPDSAASELASTTGIPEVPEFNYTMGRNLSAATNRSDYWSAVDSQSHRMLVDEENGYSRSSLGERHLVKNKSGEDLHARAGSGASLDRASKKSVPKDVSRPSGLSVPRISSMDPSKQKQRFSFLWNLRTSTATCTNQANDDFTHRTSDADTTPNWMDHFIAPTSSQQIQIEGRMTSKAIDDSWIGAVMSPIRIWRIIWEIVHILGVFVHLWAVGFALAFVSRDDDLPQWLEIMLSVCFGIFCFDMGLRFFMGTVVGGKIIVDKATIGRRYLRSWFLVDLMSITPQLVYILGSGNVPRYIGWLALLRLLRVVNIHGWCRLFWMHAHVYHDQLRYLVYLLEIHVLLLVLVHLNCLCWASLQPLERETRKALELYLESLRWSLSALTCGTDLPTTSTKESLGEQILSIVISLERVTLLVILLVVVVWEQVKRIQLEDFGVLTMQERVLRYMRARHIPITLQMEFLRLTGEQGVAQTWQEGYILLLEQELPKYLRLDIFNKLWAERLRTLGLLEELMEWSPEFGKELALLVQELAVGPYTVLYTSGEASTAAYFILSGVLASANSSPFAEDPTTDYIKGMWVGEKAIVNPDLRRTETIFSKEPCQLMMVPAAEFKKMVNLFGLTKRFEGLIQKKLWKGLCGRCGILGDHFAADCPHTQPNKTVEPWKRGSAFTSRFGFRPFGRVASNASSRGGDIGTEKEGMDKDFMQFIVENNMTHLIKLFAKYDISSLDDITRATVEEMISDKEIQIAEEEARILFEAGSRFKRKLMRSCTQLLANVGNSENHLIFISHSKVEAGTEAALMQKDFEKILKEDPSIPVSELEAPIFLDSEDLRDLGELQAHVERSHNLVILLTKKVLTRPWVLIEIVTAIRAGTKIVPVEIQRRDMSFDFPDEAYHERLLAGKELDAGCLDLLGKENIDLATLDAALRQVFNRIALPFSPHKTANVRKAELQDILKQCRVRGSMHHGVGAGGVTSMTPGGLISGTPTITSTLNRTKSTLNRLGSTGL